MSMARRLGPARHRCFSIPDRSRDLLGHARRDPGHRARGLAPVDAGRHADQLGEARAEGPQRRAADVEADLGDAELAATQQRHRALDAPRHQVAVGGLAVGELELAAEVPGRHVRAAGERLDVQRLRILPIDPVTHAAQQREVAQVLLRRGSAGHLRDRGTYPGTPSAPTASPAAMSSLAAPTSPAPSTDSIARTRPPSRYQTANGPESMSPRTTSSSQAGAGPTYSIAAQSERSEKKYGTTSCGASAPSMLR